MVGCFQCLCRYSIFMLVRGGLCLDVLRLMAVPVFPNAKLFYRCAFQRFDEAKILLRVAGSTAGKTTAGPVYLAGYATECILKALIFASTPINRHEEILRSFRGNRGHD